MQVRTMGQKPTGLKKPEGVFNPALTREAEYYYM